MKIKGNKGQAAFAFLMEYGWAILVVLAAVGALAYFSVFDVCDESCKLKEVYFEAVVVCEDIYQEFVENDVLTHTLISNFLVKRMEAKVPAGTIIRLRDASLDKYETDSIVNMGGVDDRVLWSVTCNVDAEICSPCNLEVERDCGCNKLVIRAYFNQTELASFNYLEE